ncbi:hypothetical protein AYR66_26605 [Noviherbaspirillum denitrificans]|uniref:histidine kinase n=1 Tax=Noviherbaspirillum denitrificans TaxID=1968433 RepID=A0A254TPI1_9BURK|nr:hypothetical protein AYR66_26605 [Noviherbaspirillum denitrificans]
MRAESGEEALKQILRNEFAVVLLDIRMPGLTGFETARLIRDHPRSGRLPIIFITASEDSRFPVDEAYALGAVDYLTKPIVPAVLRAKVAFFVELHRKTEELARVERSRHEAAISARDERIQMIFDNIKDYAFIVVDTEGRITEWKGGAECLTGWGDAEAAGKPLAILFTEEDRLSGCPEGEMARARECGRAEDQRWLERKDGTRFFADGILMALNDAAGIHVGYVKIFRDVTAQRLAADALQASEERYRTLFESIDEGFCIIEMHFDDKGKPVDYRFIETNPAFEKQTGLIDASGKTVRELVPDLDAHWFEIYGNVALTGEPKRFVDEAVAMGRWFDVYAAPTGGPGSRRLAVLFTDITERKRTDEDIRRLAADLSEANRRKNEFLATLAHELRNPLAPLQAGIDLLRSAADDTATVNKVRDLMERQLKHMVHLVDDLLDIARITGNQLSLRKERVDLKNLVAAAVETSQPLIDAGRHRLTIEMPEAPILLYADPTRVAQVLSNLLNNAARYTPQGGRIMLAVHRSDTDAFITVTDNGIGIPPESLEMVFDMFTRVGREGNNMQGGLGIGLSLVRRLVEMHGGTVSATSAGTRQGTTFTVRLPALQAGTRMHPENQHASSGNEPVATQRLRILIADDNTDAAESLSTLLEVSGHTTCVASDGRRALAMAQDFRPDVVFLDIGMPGMSGYEVALALRKTPGVEQAYLVALTGWGSNDDQARSKAAGFDHHLTKPARFADIEQLLRVFS